MSSDIPRFHDGLLVGIILREGSATVHVKDASGVEYALDLDGIEALQMDEFRQANSISNIEVVEGRTPDADTVFDRLFWPPHASAGQEYHDEHATLVRRQVNQIEAGELKLVLIVPSYGADLLAVCRHISCRAI